MCCIFGEVQAKKNYVTLHLTTTPVVNGLLELLLTVRHS